MAHFTAFSESLRGRQEAVKTDIVAMKNKIFGLGKK
jgi:hypothetical protein